MNTRILLIIFFLALPLLCWAQEFIDQKEVGVVLISKHNEQKVWLRWAPTTAIAWELGNANGWWVQRVLIPSATEPGDTSYTLLSKNPYKPMPLGDWEAPSDTSDYAATAAQVLYGETLEIASTSGAMSLIDKSRELETRFSFGLSAAESDFEVAQMMGLGAIDENVLPGRTYVYRVFANITDSLAVVDTAGVAVNLSQKYELPRVFDLSAGVRDTTISLSWPAGYHKGIYSTYSVEKRVANGTFKPVNRLPLANMFAKGKNDFNHYFTDTHTAEGDTLYYRVRGITPFADYGPPSDSVKAVIPMLFPLPTNLKYSVVSNEQIAVAWEYPHELENKVGSFEIFGAMGFKHKPFSLGQHSVDSRAAIITIPTAEFYLSVAAKGVDGSRRMSHPIMIQMHDSIPPAPPTGVVGTISRRGMATVSWQRGTEPDLFGYKVYTHSKPHAEFNMETKSFVRDTTFQFKLNLKTLSSKLYVKVMAYDYRYNFSQFSQMLTLTVPDIIPPSAPVLKRCVETPKGIEFEWIPSGSSDVASHAIVYTSAYRVVTDTLGVFPHKNQSQFIWEAPIEGNHWFWVVAIDTSGNSTRSTQHFRLNLKGIDFANFSPKLTVNKNLAKGHIELSWSTHSNATSAIIYRSLNDEPYRTYNTLKGSVFNDDNVAVGNKYGYLIRLQNDNGVFSMYSEEIKINF